MVSISDLGNGRKVDAVMGGLTPDEQSVLNAEYATQARAAAALQGILDQNAQMAAVLSGKIPTKLDRRPEGWKTKILNIEPSPAIAIMREQAAHARMAREEASRPRWKSWKFWTAIFAGIGGCITFAITVYPFMRDAIGL